MPKFEIMLEQFCDGYVFIVDDHFIKRVSADAATRSLFFWKADGEAIQIAREAFSDVDFIGYHVNDPQGVHIRDVQDQSHTFRVFSDCTHGFLDGVRDTLWDWD